MLSIIVWSILWSLFLVIIVRTQVGHCHWHLVNLMHDSSNEMVVTMKTSKLSFHLRMQPRSLLPAA